MSSGNYSEFLTALGQYESGNNYSFESSLGYLGRYQFAEEALTDVGLYEPDGSGNTNDFVGSFTPWAESTYGVTDKASFLASSEAQDYAVQAWFEKIIADAKLLGVDKYVGETVGGIEITTSGIIAGTHLVGIWRLRDFLESGGADAQKDGYGTSVAQYVEQFGGYETPFTLGDEGGETSDPPPTEPPPPGGEDDGADDPAGASTVAIGDGGRQAEGEEFVFTVTRSGDASGSALVDYYAWSPEAGAADFTGAVAGTARFAAGETEALVRIASARDDLSEDEELFHVALSNPRGVELGAAQGDGWIVG